MSYPENFKSPLVVAENIKEIIKGKKVCELGCGVGDLLLEMKKYAGEVTGMERGKEWCEEAKRRGLNVICGDILIDDIPEADVYYLWVNHILRDKILDKIENETEGKTIILGYNLNEVSHPFKKHGDLIFTVPATNENLEFKISIVDKRKITEIGILEITWFKILALIDRIRLKIKSLKRKINL